jgi:hypothetical protein
MQEEKKPLPLAAKFLTEEGKFKLGEFLNHYETEMTSVNTRIEALSEAIAFFAKWWDENHNPEKKAKVSLLVPDHLANYRGPEGK